MADHHSLVKRVIHALDADQDPDTLVSAYFDEDRNAVIQAAIQTLEATREDADPERVSRAVDRELIEGLRFPLSPPGGILPTLFVHGRRAGLVVAFLLALGTALILL